MTKSSISQVFRSVFEPELIEEIEKVGNPMVLKADTPLIEIGNYVISVPLVLSGSIKILRADNEGKELLLYFLHSGETCAMALSCCLGRTKSEIKAVAETDVEIITIPINYLEDWASRFKSWRNFVYQSYHKQLTDAFNAIDILAFSKLDERLKIYLESKNQIAGNNELKITHQEIANDLNSSRVVISRILKQLEKEGLIELGHNVIYIKNL